MFDLSRIIKVDQICDLEATTKEEALTELCRLLHTSPYMLDRNRFHEDILAREQIMSTGIGSGIAIPHAKTTAVDEFVMAVGRSKAGIEFEALDSLPVNIIILMGSPESKKAEFLKLIAKLGEVFMQTRLRERFIAAKNHEEMMKLLLMTAD